MERIEIVFDGENITLENTSAKYIADFINKFYTFASNYAKEDTQKFDKDKLIVLQGVESNCLKITFASSLIISSMIFNSFCSTIASKDVTQLPKQLQKPFVDCVEHAKQRNISLTAMYNNQQYTIKPDEILYQERESLIMGATQIYGTIMSVGGITDIKITMKIMDAETLVFAVSKEKAQELGKRLYQFVGLSGTAKWDLETDQIKEFEMDELLAYEETPVSEAFSYLRRNYGHYFDKINPDEYVNEIRGE